MAPLANPELPKALYQGIYRRFQPRSPIWFQDYSLIKVFWKAWEAPHFPRASKWASGAGVPAQGAWLRSLATCELPKGLWFRWGYGCFYTLWILLVRVLMQRALLFGVCIWAIAGMGVPDAASIISNMMVSCLAIVLETWSRPQYDIGCYFRPTLFPRCLC